MAIVASCPFQEEEEEVYLTKARRLATAAGPSVFFLLSDGLVF